MAGMQEGPSADATKKFIEDDRCANALGIRFAELAPGRAAAGLIVREDMLNGHGTCHGGIMFTLADAVFAVLSNSRGARAVAQFCSIAYMRPAKLGDQLMAVGTESIVSGRRGIYDITVSCGDEVVAAFRGHARAIDDRG